MTDLRPRTRNSVLGLLAALVLCLGIGFGTAGIPQADSPDQGGTSANIGGENQPQLAFRSASKLQDHFEKHGAEVGCSTAEEYLAAANDLVANEQALSKTQADGDTAYFLERTGEFAVVSPDGHLRTYYLADRDYFDRQ